MCVDGSMCMRQSLCLCVCEKGSLCSREKLSVCVCVCVCGCVCVCARVHVVQHERERMCHMVVFMAECCLGKRWAHPSMC